MSAQTWQLGDKHPDAPWTAGGTPITCGACGGLSVQGLGTQAIELYRGVVPHAWCRECFPKAMQINDGPATSRNDVQRLEDAGMFEYAKGRA